MNRCAKLNQQINFAKKKKSTDQQFKIVKDNDSVNEDKYALEKHSATFDNDTVDRD